MLKNIPQNEALLLTELIPYQAGQVVSRTLSQNPHVSVTLFAFDKGERSALMTPTAMRWRWS